MRRSTLRALPWAAWVLTLTVSMVYYHREDALVHFLWHLAYGGAAGLILAAAWTAYRGRVAPLPTIWVLGGYLFMIVPDLIWLGPTLVGRSAHDHEPWMDLFLGHVFLDTWHWTTILLVPTVTLAVGLWAGAVRYARRGGRAGPQERTED